MDTSLLTNEALDDRSANRTLELDKALEMKSARVRSNLMSDYEILDTIGDSKRADVGNIFGRVVVEGEHPGGDLTIHVEMFLKQELTFYETEQGQEVSLVILSGNLFAPRWIFMSQYGLLGDAPTI